MFVRKPIENVSLIKRKNKFYKQIYSLLIPHHAKKGVFLIE